MFFIKPGHNTEIFGINDLILISDIFTPELIEEVKQNVPELNITSIAGAVGPTVFETECSKAI